MTQKPIYKMTSIARPLDPCHATNLAVLLLMPLGAAIAGAISWFRDGGNLEIAGAALVGAVVIFGTWALARELAPDDNPAAFASMALGFVTLVVADPPGLLLLFTALFLVRIVNRTVGLPAKITDSVLVAALTLWAVYSTHSALLSAVAAVAFVLDAVMRDGRRHQWIFAAICLIGGILISRYGISPADPVPLSVVGEWWVATVGVGYIVTALLMRPVKSTGDVSGTPLSMSRVRAGILIGFLVVLQALNAGAAGLESASLVWAAMAGVALMGMIGLAKPAGSALIPPTR